MALTKVIGAGLGTLTEDQVLGGATPTLTIGDAGAEDAKIIFDGNAQDYHIGLDDSADQLTIGLGSALGTTTHMKFDSTGIITMPLQPSIMFQGSNSNNKTINHNEQYGSTDDGQAAFSTSTATFSHSIAGITYASATGRFTVTTAGIYLVYFQTYANSSSAATVRTAIYRNDVRQGMAHVQSLTYGSSNVSACLKCAANDFIDFRSIGGGDLVIYEDANHVYGYITKVS